jgi:hypothetical protein
MADPPPMIAASIVSGMLTAPVLAVCAKKGARTVRPARSPAVDHRPPSDVGRPPYADHCPDETRTAYDGCAQENRIADSDRCGSQRSKPLRP